MKVCVLGLGYIGLPTASIIANSGHDVIGVDVSPKVVETINRGEIHIVEPDLDILVKSGVNSGKLKASLEPAEADVFFICVPTPFKEGYKPDLKYVEDATEAIVPFVRKGNLVVLESTSPVGTTENVVAKILKKSGLIIGEELYIAHAPERVLPGKIIEETVNNDRIIGGINAKSTEICKSFYKTFVNGNILTTDAKTAELAKLVENSYRDVNIAYVNELSNICDELNINVHELIKISNQHPRVNLLNPGPGVGGHCLAVDPWFIIDSVPEKSQIIKLARQSNENRPNIIIEKIQKLASQFENPIIGCLGITYKPDIDDIRESPALEIVRKLRLQYSDTIIHDPYMNYHKLEIPHYDLQNILDNSDILVILVNHKEYYAVDFNKLNKPIIDTRGMLYEIYNNVDGHNID